MKSVKGKGYVFERYIIEWCIQQRKIHIGKGIKAAHEGHQKGRVSGRLY